MSEVKGQESTMYKRQNWKKIPMKKKKYRKPASKQAFANKLRKNMTSAELLLWGRLREMDGCEWEAQKVVAGYIPDFVEEGLELIVEVDGPYHRYQTRKDNIRTRNLQKRGYQVMRFQNSEILLHIDSVVSDIRQRCQEVRGLLYSSSTAYQDR